MTTDIPCDEILMAAMAIADGEAPPLPVAVVEAHIAVCPSCRVWESDLVATAGLLDGSRRRGDSRDLWPSIEPRLAEAPTRWARTTPFLVLALALVGYRALLVAAAWPAMALKLLALAAIVATFVAIKENPFTIKSELALGRE